MADTAICSFSATCLPDEIQKIFTGSLTVAPADANDKWYYKLTSVSNASTDLIAGYFTDYTAVDDDTAPTAVHTADLCKFLYVSNTDSSNHVYINIAGGTAAAAAGNIYVNAGEAVCLNLATTTVADIHAISSTSTVNCIVAALLDDVA